jgi:hypothetical protein
LLGQPSGREHVDSMGREESANQGPVGLDEAERSYYRDIGRSDSKI